MARKRRRGAVSSESAALKVHEDHVENIWLADKEKCDVVVCVTDKSNVGPSSKKRICAVSAGGDCHTNCDAVSKRALQSGQQFIKLHTVSEQLLRSPYFETCLKESWCKQKAKEGAPVELPLETLVASSKAYQRCIEILCSAERCSAHMFACPLEALDIYLASDHLLFKECSVACMEYLAAVPWSNEERKVIYETFSTSGIKPSADMAARLGLSKEEPSENLSKTLWCLYERVYLEDEVGGSDRSSRFQDLISDLLKGNGKNLNESSKKIFLDFLYKATDDCVQQLKNCTHIAADDWVYEKHFFGWLHMMQLILDISDGKEAVEALACDEDLYALFIPTFDNILAEYERSVILRDVDSFSCNAHVRTNYDIDLHQLMRAIVKVLKVLAEGFKRVAEAEIIVPESTRNALILCWVPWLEKYHDNEKICEVIDIPGLKVHIYKILQTLSMNDDCVLRTLAKGALDGDYFLEGAFKAWCDRLD